MKVLVDGRDPNIVAIISGTYIGNSTVNRTIPHGLGKTPIYVRIINNEAPTTSYKLDLLQPGMISCQQGANDSSYAVTTMDSINFYVGNASHYPYSGNDNLKIYTWVAFG